jgi:PTS system nitrogen regulatory IIA component
VSAADTRELFGRMLDEVVRWFPTLPRDETLRELLQREQVVPTAIGHGIAIPHVSSRAMAERVCVVARIDPGIAFSPDDLEPVVLMFMLLSPQGDPEGHLATIAEIARIAMNPHWRRRLMNAEDPLTLFTLLRGLSLREGTAAPSYGATPSHQER